MKKHTKRLFRGFLLLLCLAFMFPTVALADDSAEITYEQSVPGGTIIYQIFVNSETGKKQTSWTVSGYTGNITEAPILDKIDCYTTEFGKISGDVTYIGEAFFNCTNLVNVSIPLGVTGIAKGAFDGCTSLKSITLSGNISGQFSFPFAGLPVTDVTILPGSSKIGMYLFYGMKNITEVLIPDGVTKIELASFCNCTGLTSISIPSSVTSIGERAFDECKKLQDVYFSGSEEQWNAINISRFNNSLSKATIHYNSSFQTTGSQNPKPTELFSDVAASAYYADAVSWAIDRGITNGTSATTFSPDATCTQVQIITFLYRAMGTPAVSADNMYTNGSISSDKYYYDAMLWAYQEGVVTDNRIDPDSGCSRSDVVTYLWRLGGKPDANDYGFADVSDSASYAKAVAWAVDTGITSGTSATTFSPDMICTRGQIVTFLYRAYAA